MHIAVLVALSFFVGSFPTSIVAGRLVHGIDIRRYGSGNAGATNTFRVLGWKAGTAVALVDVGKGLLTALVIARLRFAPEALATYTVSGDLIGILCVGAAVAGHMFPPFAGFRGGKGVGTGAGGIFGVFPLAAVVCLFVFIVTVLVSGYVSVASMLAAVTLPVASAIIQVGTKGSVDLWWIVLSSLIALVIVFMHRGNIRRLLAGEENRVEKLRLFRPRRGRHGRHGR